MVMENEIRLGDILDKLTPSDRLVIYNAARQVVYRGYAANAVHGTVNPQRRIKKMGLGMETYRATEQMWDWEKTDCRNRYQLSSSANTGWKTCNTFCISELN
jgi:hypothetical protein